MPLRADEILEVIAIVKEEIAAILSKGMAQKEKPVDVQALVEVEVQKAIAGLAPSVFDVAGKESDKKGASKK